jgi:hypothetical protein
MRLDTFDYARAGWGEGPAAIAEETVDSRQFYWIIGPSVPSTAPYQLLLVKCNSIALTDQQVMS